MKSNTNQLDLFNLALEEPPFENMDTPSFSIPNSAKTEESANSFLSFGFKYANEIEMYLKFKFTAHEICTQLIEEHEAPNETYTTGKPKIYPYVMMYLDYLDQQGQCIAKQRDPYEGIYEWIG